MLAFVCLDDSQFINRLPTATAAAPANAVPNE